MKAQKIILAGGTGFLGQSIINHLDQYEFVVLCRRPEAQAHNVRYVKWDGKTLGTWAAEIEGCFAVINLVGRSVDCRYTEENKKEIITSRVNATSVLGQAIQQCAVPPSLWINCASSAIYREAPDRPMDEETAEYGEGFSVNVCKEWEKTFDSFETPGTRKVLYRISLVLGKDAGVFPVFQRLVKFGLGGKQGNGEQYMSWIHETDFVKSIKWIIDHNELEGVFNCAAPNPTTNAEFMRLMRKENHMPIGLPATVWMLKVGAWIIGTEAELILKSRRVVPARLTQSGYRFEYPDVHKAIIDLVKK
jgi:uncharacterized protein (TIGR01777 family)